jgi:hypothetical protein
LEVLNVRVKGKLPRTESKKLGRMLSRKKEERARKMWKKRTRRRSLGRQSQMERLGS